MNYITSTINDFMTMNTSFQNSCSLYLLQIVIPANYEQLFLLNQL